MTIKNLVYILAVAFGLSFLDGALKLGFSDGFTILLGLIDLVCLVWLVVLVSGSTYKSNK